MKTTGYIFLLSREFRRNKGRTLTVIVSLFVASFFVLLAMGLRNGVIHGLIPEIERAFPEKMLLAKPRTLTLGGIRLDTETITPELLQKIRGVKGVSYVSPQISLVFPCRAVSQIFGNIFSTDVVVIGVEDRIVQPDVAPGRTFVYSPDKPIPVLTSQYFLNLYNLGLSDSLSLPKFNESSGNNRIG